MSLSCEECSVPLSTLCTFMYFSNQTIRNAKKYVFITTGLSAIFFKYSQVADLILHFLCFLMLKKIIYCNRLKRTKIMKKNNIQVACDCIFFHALYCVVLYGWEKNTMFVSKFFVCFLFSIILSPYYSKSYCAKCLYFFLSFFFIKSNWSRLNHIIRLFFQYFDE